MLVHKVDNTAIQKLSEELTSPSLSTRLRGIEMAVAMAATDDVQPQLIELARHENVAVRKEAVLRSAIASGGDARKALEAAARDSIGSVAEAARQSLARLQTCDADSVAEAHSRAGGATYMINELANSLFAAGRRRLSLVVGPTSITSVDHPGQPNRVIVLRCLVAARLALAFRGVARRSFGAIARRNSFANFAAPIGSIAPTAVSCRNWRPPAAWRTPAELFVEPDYFDTTNLPPVLEFVRQRTPPAPPRAVR